MQESKPDSRFIHLKLCLPMDTYDSIETFNPIDEATERIRSFGRIDDMANTPLEDRKTVNIILYYQINSMEYIYLCCVAKKAKIPIEFILPGDGEKALPFRVPLALRMHLRMHQKRRNTLGGR